MLDHISGALPLDDPRWSALRHAYGPAEDVPEMIVALMRGEEDRDVRDIRDRLWHRIWSALCHQGSVYSASYAAVPYIVAIGAARPAAEQLDFWSFVGGVVGSHDAAPVPDDVRSAFDAAVAEAHARALACVEPGLAPSAGAWLLVALAGMRRWSAIGVALEGLVDGEIAPECPSCEAQLYVTTTRVPFEVSAEDPVRRKPARTTLAVAAEPRPELVELARLARRAEIESLAEQVLALEATVTCPSCEATFHLLDVPG